MPTVSNYRTSSASMRRRLVGPEKVMKFDRLIIRQELMGKRYDYVLGIPYARGVKWIQDDQTRGVTCRFKFFGDILRSTVSITGKMNVDFNYSRQFTIQSVQKPFLDYLEHGALIIEVRLWYFSYFSRLFAT